MKKLFSSLLAAVMVLSIAGCSGAGSDSSSVSDSSSTNTLPPETSSTVDDGGSTSANTLSNPVKMTEDGDIDMTAAMAYQTDFDALIDSFNAKEVDPTKPVSANLNENAQGVFDYLRSIYGKQMIACQQMMGTDCYEDIVYYNAASDMPAMKGYDFIFCTGSYVDDSMITEAIEWHKESGGLVTFTWHWNVPRDIDNPDMGWAFYQEDILNWSQVNAVTPGTKEYEQVIHDIDVIASKLQWLESEGVTVLFRPLHEASGKWFWWGLQNKESAENEVFQKLWYMIYDRMENYHKLTNIIWVWNGQSKHCYVHPNSYDIAGIDFYANAEEHGDNRGQYDSVNGFNIGCHKKYCADDYVLPEDIYQGKMLALSECGYLPDPAKCVETDTMWLYYMIWNGDFVYEASGNGTAITSLDGTPSPNTERMTNEMIVEFFSNDALITLRKLPSQFTEGKDIPQSIKNWEYFKMD